MGRRWYHTNICSVHRRGRSIRRWSVIARRCGASCARSVSSRRGSTQRAHRDRARGRRRGDWKAAGCSSQCAVARADHEQRLPHRRAHHANQRGTARPARARPRASARARSTLDQVAAAAPLATPESDAEIARIAVGKAPSQIALAARTIVPPKVADDQALYERRALQHDLDERQAASSPSADAAARAGRRVRAGHPEHRQEQRAADKQDGTILDWQQSAADALVTLARQAGDGGRRREAQPDHADRAPQRRRSRRCSKAPARSAPRPPSGSPATHAASPSSRTAATSCTHASDAAPPTPSSARCYKRSAALPIPRLHRHPRTPSPPPHRGRARRHDRTRQPHPALPPPPQAPPRPPHPHQRQRRPADLRRPSRTRDHHQPATRATWVTGRPREAALDRP